MSFLRKRLTLHAVELIFLEVPTVLRLIVVELMRDCGVSVQVGTGVVGVVEWLHDIVADGVVVAGEGSELLVLAPLSHRFLFFGRHRVH